MKELDELNKMAQADFWFKVPEKNESTLKIGDFFHFFFSDTPECSHMAHSTQLAELIQNI